MSSKRDPFEEVLGPGRGQGPPASQKPARQRIREFLERVNAEDEAAGGDHRRVQAIADNLQATAEQYALRLDDGALLMEYGGSPTPEGDMRDVYDSESGEWLGFVLLLYDASYRSNPAVTFARFLPLTAQLPGQVSPPVKRPADS